MGGQNQSVRPIETQLQTWSSILIKKTPAQVLSYEICEIYKTPLFYRTPPVDASLARLFC